MGVVFQNTYYSLQCSGRWVVLDHPYVRKWLVFWWKMSFVLTICHIIRLYKCEHCTLTYSNKITLVWFLHFFFYLGGRWFSKILRNIWGWYVKILTIPYRGGWVVWKRPKTFLRNIKMAPYKTLLFKLFFWRMVVFWQTFILTSF